MSRRFWPQYLRCVASPFWADTRLAQHGRNELAEKTGPLAGLRKLSPDIPVILCSGYDETQVMAEEHQERPTWENHTGLRFSMIPSDMLWRTRKKHHIDMNLYNERTELCICYRLNLALVQRCEGNANA